MVFCPSCENEITSILTEDKNDEIITYSWYFEELLLIIAHCARLKCSLAIFAILWFVHLLILLAFVEYVDFQILKTLS